MAKKTLTAYVRYDGTGRIVPGSLLLRVKKPSGKYKALVNPAAYLCCNPTTTTL